VSRFEFFELPLLGLTLVQRKEFRDQRGTLSRMFCREELALAGWTKPIAQVNWVSNNRSGTVRGMHYQAAPHADAKLVACLRGTIFDVVVDVRRGSRTFLRHEMVELSAANGRALLVPEGFAHGYQCMTDNVEMLYLHSAPHVQSADRGLNPTDPRLAIAWPAPVGEISDRDRAQILLDTSFEGEII
jgi:dTDP-4-dehydrorhamnose 3,5-epimerase